MAKKESKTITVEQIGSPIRRPKDQRATLVRLDERGAAFCRAAIDVAAELDRELADRIAPARMELLKDALRRTLMAADIAGIRAVLVHAKDDGAREWYRKFDFKEGTTDPFHLFLVLKDLKQLLGA